MAEIRTVAVVGAGVMGRRIAHLAALAGYRTILEDILPAALRKAEGEIRSRFGRAIGAGTMSSAAAGAALQCLEYASTVEQAAREADLVIEAVPDELESKLEIFILLDKLCKPHTVLACTTSSLSVTEIASVTYRAGKILGMRFPDTEHSSNLLEIARGSETDAEAVAACAEVGRRMGKEVVLVTESQVFNCSAERLQS
jgi:3-hydroxybutyryl-CoA dehydrogenase